MENVLRGHWEQSDLCKGGVVPPYFFFEGICNDRKKRKCRPRAKVAR